MAIRETSKALFGNSFRLEILALIAALEREFYPREIALHLGVADNLVTGQLAKLHEAGLLSRRSSNGTLMYGALDSSIWEAARALHQELAQRHPAIQEHRSPTHGEPHLDASAREGSLAREVDEHRRLAIRKPSSSATTKPVSQHMQAIQRANQVRSARSQLKRAVAENRMTAAEVILACPWEAATMTISELLMSQRRWGTTRTSKFLSAVGMTQTKTIGSMTDRQRQGLARILGPAGPTAPL
jgi:DNA-binding MarR family transcriptional regulator